MSRKFRTSVIATFIYINIYDVQLIHHFNEKSVSKVSRSFFILSIILALVLSSCNLPSGAQQTEDPNAIFTQAALTVQAQLNQTATPAPFNTPTVTIPTLTVEEQLQRIDLELKNSLQSSFSYLAPTTMKLDETFTIRLLLNPSLSPDELATQVVESSRLATSTAEPGKVVINGGGEVNVISNTIDITPYMKAVLKPESAESFEIQQLHDNEIQIVSGTDTTTWQWIIKAKKEGEQKLTLVIYRLVKFDEKDNWREVKTYKSDINVKVTFDQRLKSFDWKWLILPLITLLLIPAFWRWYDNKQKRKAQETQSRAERVRNRHARKGKNI